ncbi:DNA-processing protein DprA [Leifsonia sp. McL0607]|uniref:DNA-processing protein DprA n=1 Tax=Leifsonia sp. McL0607 TaxID=3415672 RepID=UPI003CEBB208
MTATFTSSITEIRNLARHLNPAAARTLACLTDDSVARIAWSIISEPADTAAGELIAVHGAADALAIALTGEPTPDTDRWRSRYAMSLVLGALEAADRGGIQVITPAHPQWPARLDDLDTAAPYLLWVDGDIAAPSGDLVTVTGCRAASSYGERIASEISTDLIGTGRRILTGAAYGVDAAATRTALHCDSAPVIVLAGGVDRPYPAGNIDLIQRVAAQGGAIVSELPPGTTPTRWRFQARGRILAALASTTLIVEAGACSGTLPIAVEAHRLGRRVFAAPGPLTSYASTGCHQLISDGTAAIYTGTHSLS